MSTDCNTNSDKHYEGKPCIKCGKVLRYKNNKKCVSCRRMSSRRWCEENPERRKAYSHQWSITNRKRRRVSSRKWYRANPEYMKKYNSQPHVKRKNSIRLKANRHLGSASDYKCMVCGNQAQNHHHWNGYSNESALDVVQLCRNCHNSIETHLITRRTK